jgi:hypothetical protein
MSTKSDWWDDAEGLTFEDTNRIERALGCQVRWEGIVHTGRADTGRWLPASNPQGDRVADWLRTHFESREQFRTSKP